MKTKQFAIMGGISGAGIYISLQQECTQWSIQPQNLSSFRGSGKLNPLKINNQFNILWLELLL